MIKYCFDYQSYFCHFGASETTHMYDTREEAEHDMSWCFRHNDDAYVSNVYKKVVITPEEKLLHDKRLALKQVKSFDYKKDSDAYGIITFWDGSKDAFFIVGDFIYFLVSKERYPLYQFQGEHCDCSLKYIKA